MVYPNIENKMPGYNRLLFHSNVAGFVSPLRKFKAKFFFKEKLRTTSNTLVKPVTSWNSHNREVRIGKGWDSNLPM